MKSFLRPLILTLAWAGAAAAQAQTAGALKVQQPWARVTVVGQQAGGAFLTIQNTGSTADKLLGASTPAAQRVELHTMTMDGDVMKMREVPAIELPAGQTVRLQPGGQHLMLMGLKAPLQRGQKLPLTLKFEKAGELSVELSVDTAAPGSTGGAPAHRHHH